MDVGPRHTQQRTKIGIRPTSIVHIALDMKAVESHLMGFFFSPLVCFHFLDLTPSSILYFFLLSLFFSHWISLSCCDSLNIRCRECIQTDLFLFGKLLIAKRQNLFSFLAHLSLWLETYISQILKTHTVYVWAHIYVLCKSSAEECYHAEHSVSWMMHSCTALSLNLYVKVIFITALWPGDFHTKHQWTKWR